MPKDDLIPSFLSLRASKGKPKRATGKLTQPFSLPDQPSLLFGPPVEPHSPPNAEESKPASHVYAPIVLAPPEPPRAREPILYTVRQLLNEVRQSVERTYAGILTVEGEVSNCRPAASGHVYLTLKDGDAQLSVVMFRRQAGLLGFKPKDGLSVEVRGRISVYETRGQLQLVAETMRPRGEGALQLAFEQLKKRLSAEGLFDAVRKRPLPPFPHCIGIVTSTNGAALRDIIQVVRRRHARLNLLIYPATMQGPQCPPSVTAGIRWFNRNSDRVDLILIARGGGSFEDLAGFNDEALARAIAASELPIVSAIGHEIDSTIADFVADLRAPTPSAAAELITAAQHRIAERIISLENRVYRAAQYHLIHARQRLSRLSAEQVLARLRDSISLRHQRVDELRFRLASAIERQTRARAHRVAALESRLRRHDPTVRLALAQRRLESASSHLLRIARDLINRRRTRLQQANARLEALSPLAVLNRGYAIVYAESAAGVETILRDAAEATPDQIIRTRLAKGSVRARVETTLPETPAMETVKP